MYQTVKRISVYMLGISVVHYLLMCCLLVKRRSRVKFDSSVCGKHEHNAYFTPSTTTGFKS